MSGAMVVPLSTPKGGKIQIGAVTKTEMSMTLGESPSFYGLSIRKWNNDAQSEGLV
jgi:hypothetical protein|tara:strand:- start:1254 stop:1421 length:168 start_codon:yes stop_codon:yes gene_type:complete